MSRTDPQFKLRMPPALRARVEQAAKASLRSLNAELVLRIQQSFEGERATDASVQLPTPNPRPGLRLLCVLVRKAGHPIAQPVAVSGLPAPWAALSGRWPLALPSPFLLRETRRPLKYWHVVYDSGKPTPFVPVREAFQLEG